MEWYEILSFAIGLAGLLVGIAFSTKFRAVVQLIKEMGELMHKSADVFDRAAEALKDRKVTKAEAVLLLKAWQDVCSDFVDVLDALTELLPANAIKFLFRR